MAGHELCGKSALFADCILLLIKRHADAHHMVDKYLCDAARGNKLAKESVFLQEKTSLSAPNCSTERPKS